MTYSVDQLKGLMSSKGGIAMGNVYRVILPSLPGATSTDVNLLCSRVNIPGKQVVTYDREIGHKMEKIAYRQLYEDVTMTFFLLNDYGVRNYFDTWTDAIVDQDSYQIKYKNTYTKQIKIQQLKKGIGFPVYSTPLGLPLLPAEIQNRLPSIGGFDLAQGTFDLDFITDDKVVYEVSLEEAFPTTITGVELGNANGEILEFNVTFSYTKYNITKSRQATPNSDFITSQLSTLLTNI